MNIWPRAHTRAGVPFDSVDPMHSFGADGVLHLLQAFGGGDVADYCRDAGIDPTRLREPGFRVETPLLLQLFAAAEERTGDTSIGFHAAQRIRFGSLATHLIATQNTIGGGLAIHRQAQRLVLGANAMAVRYRDDMTYVTLETGVAPELSRHLSEYCVASSCRLMGWLTLQASRPSEIHFRHRRVGDRVEYESFFGCRVEFDADEDGAALSRAALAERVVSANEELAAELELLLRSELARQVPVAFAERVTLALRAGQLRPDLCRREVIARRLGVSTRTLQRRLQDEGTGFGEILDRIRREAALVLIVDPTMSVRAVAHCVGYGDQYAFNRAFRRWTGRSPSAYRREAAVDTNSA